MLTQFFFELIANTLYIFKRFLSFEVSFLLRNKKTFVFEFYLATLKLYVRENL